MKMFHRGNTISGFGLVAKWGIDIFCLSYLVMKHDLTVLERGAADNSVLTRTDTERVIKLIRNEPLDLYEKLFLISEVERIEKKLRFPPAPKPHPMQTPKSLFKEDSKGIDEYGALSCDWSARVQLEIEEHESEIKKNSNVFSLIGKIWFVKFSQNEWGLYPDQEKYRYIAQLLSLSDSSKSHEPEYSIYNVDLYEKVSGKGIAKDFKPGDEAMQELNESDLSDRLSVEDLRDLRKVGYSLLEQMGDARRGGNQDRIKKAEENIDAYRLHLFNEYGIKALISKDEKKISFHESYRASKEIEKLRQVVKNQISNAIKDFDRMPSFKSHLQHSLKVKSGKTFYSPEQPTAWSVSM